MVNTQGLPGYKIDRKWKFKISEVDSWVRSKNQVSDAECRGKLDD